MLTSLLVMAVQAPVVFGPGDTRPNRLTSLERDAGWELLFDGSSTDGWRRVGSDAFPENGWSVEEGALHLADDSGAGDIVTERTFEDFELELEWRIAPGANSGIKVRVAENELRYALGPEYQILDDTGNEGTAPEHTAAGLYALYAPAGRPSVAPGTWHRARIVVDGDRLEHWMDGVRVVACTIGGEDWERRREASKFKNNTGFGRGAGPIALQDHGDEVWFRSIKIRDLAKLPGTLHDLSTDGLESWDPKVGDAIWTAEDDAIHGRTGGGGQSFLLTKRTYGDFLLEIDVHQLDRGNSGIQVRSHVHEKGHLFGYQLEIDPSDRAWSGGLYDESRRGWLHDLSENPAGRATYVYGEPNRYRIECIGPWIRAWVNGVPTADRFDTLDLEGVVALQVHSGNNTDVRWSNIRLRELGTRRWTPIYGGTLEGWEAHGGEWKVEQGVLTGRSGMGAASLIGPEVDDFTARLRIRGGEEPMFLAFRAGSDPERAKEALESGAFASHDRAIVPLWKPGEWQDVGICVYGDRATVQIDGKQAYDRRIEAEDSGALMLHLPKGRSKPFELASFELVGAAE